MIVGRKDLKTIDLIYVSEYIVLFQRYYHEKSHFHRLMRMLSNEVVARAKSLVNHNVLDKLNEVGITE